MEEEVLSIGPWYAVERIHGLLSVNTGRTAVDIDIKGRTIGEVIRLKDEALWLIAVREALGA